MTDVPVTYVVVENSRGNWIFAQYGALEVPFAHISKSRVKIPCGGGLDETGKGRCSGREKTARYLARSPKWRSGVRRMAFLLLSEERPEAKGRQFIPYFYRCISGTNAPQSHPHKHTRGHSTPSHGWPINTDNSCTCTSSSRGASLSQNTFAGSHKGAGRICHPPSVRLHLLPFLFPSHLLLELKKPFDPLQKRGKQKKKTDSIRLLSVFLCRVICSRPKIALVYIQSMTSVMT